MMKTFMKSVTRGGVTLVQFAPPSAVVGADPDAVGVLVGGSNRVNHLRADRSALARRYARRIRADALRHVPCLAREIRTDLLPVDPAVNGLPEHVVAVEQGMRIDGGEDDRLRSHGSVGGLAHRSRPTPSSAGEGGADVGY